MKVYKTLKINNLSKIFIFCFILFLLFGFSKQNYESAKNAIANGYIPIALERDTRIRSKVGMISFSLGNLKGDALGNTFICFIVCFPFK